MSEQGPGFVVKKVREPRADEVRRLLVDRLWPRGVSKAVADLDGWPKDVTPSTHLRKAVHAGEMTFEAFVEAYRRELAESSALRELARELSQVNGVVALLISGDPSKPNHADVLAEALRDI